MIEGIMDFVFNNLFIVIIAIAIISNLVSSSKKTQRKNEQRESQGSSSSENAQTREPETLESKIDRNLKKFENVFEQEKDVFEEKVSEPNKPVEKAMTSIEEHRNKQREALADRYRTNTETNKKDEPQHIASSLDGPAVISHHNKKSAVSKKSLKRRISNKGLQESIVMAEVLGKPRALKPYKAGRTD